MKKLLHHSGKPRQLIGKLKSAKACIGKPRHTRAALRQGAAHQGRKQQGKAGTGKASLGSTPKCCCIMQAPHR
jgi:hypothetical protein